jgi:hypothetical protein
MKQCRRGFVCAVLGVATSVTAFSQRRVASENLYESVVAVVPMTGSGTTQDPKRPMFAPWPYDPIRHSWLRNMTFELSDDGKYAIVQFVVQDRKFLKPLFDARGADIKAFVRGKDDPAEIEREVRQFKRDFDRNRFIRPQHKAVIDERAKGAK